jgi:adenosylhomocysteinase
MDFAEWAELVSQRTNRSLAGAAVYLKQDLTEEELPAPSLLGAWGLHEADAADDADFIYPELPDEPAEDAAEAIDYAAAHMPVSRELAEEIASQGTLKGLRIALSLIIEPKTAVLARRLRAAGATVGIYCHAHECHKEVADELKREGFLVEADALWTPREEKEGSLRLLDELKPQIIVDDGANISRLMVMERPHLLKGFVGVSEETTSGVRAFEAMERTGELPFPVIAVNDSALKTSFDNRHGTGETCATTMQKLLGAHCFADAWVAVFGFGPVGQGFAERIRALGAYVAIVELDPRAAMKALYAGFALLSAEEALSHAGIVVSATGVRHTLTNTLLEHCHEGAVVAVIGGIAQEIALDEIEAAGGQVGTGDVSDLVLPSGKHLQLLAEGNGVNYTAGPGNPIEIMDLSFAVQLAAVEHLAKAEGIHPHKVLRFDEETDKRLAETALAVRGIRIDEGAGPLVRDWRQTRYSEEEA